MSNRVLHKRTEVAGQVPALTDLLLELKLQVDNQAREIAELRAL